MPALFSDGYISMIKGSTVLKKLTSEKKLLATFTVILSGTEGVGTKIPPH